MVITVLSLPGGVVQAFLCHQTLMGAALGDASVIEIQDLIGTLHRRNAVGNDDLGNIFFLGEMVDVYKRQNRGSASFTAECF